MRKSLCILMSFALLCVAGCSEVQETHLPVATEYIYSIPDYSSSAMTSSDTTTSSFIISMHPVDTDAMISRWGTVKAPTFTSTTSELDNSSSTVVESSTSADSSEVTVPIETISPSEILSSESEVAYEAPEEIVSSSSVTGITEVSEPEIVEYIDNTSILQSITKKYLYNTLNTSEKLAYTRIQACVENGSYTCEIEDLGLSTESLNVVFWAFEYENPQYLYSDDGYHYMYYNNDDGSIRISKLDINNPKGVSNKEYETFEHIVNSCLLEARKCTTAYSQLQYIHNWVIDMCSYVNNDASHIVRADGVALHNEANCQGYSRMFMYLAQSLGYSCLCVIGGNASHMWNMIELNGIWYNVDVTWDDVNYNLSEDGYCYKYFLVGEIEDYDHSVDNWQRVPKVYSAYNAA